MYLVKASYNNKQGILRMSFIKTYKKGGISTLTLDPAKDAVISLLNPEDRFSHSWGEVPVLTLHFTDINDSVLSRMEIFKADRARSLADTNKLGITKKGDYPMLPFTPYHADAILNFALNMGFERNIHIHCEYGRARSVAVAQFLSTFLYPKHELIITRDDSRANTRVYRILSKVHGII